MRQLELWTRPAERLRRVRIADIAPWTARPGSTFVMGTAETTRAIHQAQRRLPLRYICWPLLRALPRRWGLADDLNSLRVER